MGVDDVTLEPGGPGPWSRTDAERSALSWLEQCARGVKRGDIAGALALATQIDAAPINHVRPGEGRTRVLWEGLAILGALDLQVARAVEPHLDALAILHQAGLTAPAGATFGVFAAEGPGGRLRATRGDAGDSGASGAARDSGEAGEPGWRLDGVKPWCSLASHLTHALVTAWIDDERRAMFLVRLGEPGVTPESAGWESHGLPDVVSTPVRFDGVPAVPVGAPGWYLERPGFWWGAIGVAAIWYGAAVGLSRTLHAAARTREPDQIALMHVGAVDVALHAARTALHEAARAVDGGRATGRDGALLALRVRQGVADAAETVLRHVDHALGPAPLVADAEHAARVSDLRVYLRQHHAERDLAALGAQVLADTGDEQGAS